MKTSTEENYLLKIFWNIPAEQADDKEEQETPTWRGGGGGRGEKAEVGGGGGQQSQWYFALMRCPRLYFCLRFQACEGRIMAKMWHHPIEIPILPYATYSTHVPSLLEWG